MKSNILLFTFVIINLAQHLPQQLQRGITAVIICCTLRGFTFSSTGTTRTRIIDYCRLIDIILDEGRLFDNAETN